MSKNVIYCLKESDIPKLKHWAIIETGSYYENDSHYGGTTNYFVRYCAYLMKDEWEQEVMARTRKNLEGKFGHTPFTAMEVNPVIINTQISIKIN